MRQHQQRQLHQHHQQHRHPLGGAPPPPVLDAGRSAAGVLCLVMFLASSGHFGANWRQKPSKIIFQNSPVVFQNSLLGSNLAPFWLNEKRGEKGGEKQGTRTSFGAPLWEVFAPKSTLGRIIFWLSFGTSFLRPPGGIWAHFASQNGELFR